MQGSNFHTHSKFSDGRFTVREMTEHAISLGFHSLGFSDHSYAELFEDYSMKLGTEREYINEVRALSEEFADKIKLYAGIELDVDSPVPDVEFDYVIASVHGLMRGGKYYEIDSSAPKFDVLVNDGFGGSAVDMAKAYFERVTEHVMKSKPDFVGHFDLITKFGTAPESEDGYINAALEALREIVRHCNKFEMNTGAIARGLRTVPYPAEFILDAIKRLGGRIIVTSDCHYKDRLTTWFDEAEAYLSSKGFVKNSTASLNEKIGGVEIWE